MSEGEGLFFGWDVLVPLLVHSQKVEIVEALRWIGRPLSATDLANVLGGGRSITGTAYHLRKLVSAGALEEAHQTPSRGGHENFYFFAAGIVPEALA